MKKKDRRQIAEIVETVLEAERKQEIKRGSIIHNEKLIRRVLVVGSIVVVLIVTHHLTNLDPVGRIAEWFTGAWFGWFFDRGAKLG